MPDSKYHEKKEIFNRRDQIVSIIDLLFITQVNKTKMIIRKIMKQSLSLSTFTANTKKGDVSSVSYAHKTCLRCLTKKHNNFFMK